MKIKDIKNLDNNSFDEKIAEMKKELVKINAQVAIGTALKNPGHARQIKKTIARMLTIQHEPKGGEREKIITQKSENKKLEVDKKA
ncbi:50S ribosomal protein L29 [Candidatus Woesearchaeota archaeon]|nr:50S ribosomal protein L29 [Candidatus Woesearchaeota archaeon]